MDDSAPNHGSKIYVNGHRDMVGSSIVRRLHAVGYKDFVTAAREELVLAERDVVRAFMLCEKPDYAVLAAAKVGGIYANNACSAQFMFQNVAIQNNVIPSVRQVGVPR